MKYCILTSGLILTAGASIQTASAATGNITFNGTVAAVCTMVVNNSAGVMTVSPSLQSLSSKNAGGVAGVVTITTTGGVSLSVGSATSITVPAHDTAATTWTSTYLATGTHTIAETSAATPITTPGVDTVTVHLTGTKGGTDVFASGNYSATVVVTCQ
ncbi:MAG: hypothetical protein LCH86_17705 [Proteobacteria bacterium]|nr:hypothetical protein [Pseudomonadota bacterium]